MLLKPIEEKMSLLPRLEAVEYQEGVFSGEWGWEVLKGSQEISLGGVTVVELLGKAPEISDLRIVRVRRTLLPLV